MKDTFTKLRALISMKSCLIDALRSDLASAAAKIDVLTDANHALCRQNKQLIKQQQEWWTQQDQDDEWINQQLNETQNYLVNVTMKETKDA